MRAVPDHVLRATRVRSTEHFVDVEDHFRRIEIREAVYQQAADAESKILRVSSKIQFGPYRRIPALTVHERVKS